MIIFDEIQLLVTVLTADQYLAIQHSIIFDIANLEMVHEEHEQAVLYEIDVNLTEQEPVNDQKKLLTIVE